MKNRKNPIAVTRLVCAVLIICAGLLWCGTHVLGQEKQSFTKTEPWNGAGVGGKEITTETKYENGGVTVETRLLDPKGNLITHILETTKPTGETTSESEIYDKNGKLERRTRNEKNSSGKRTVEWSEYYAGGVLKSGFIYERYETGEVKRYKEYNPGSESYEEKELPKAKDNSTPQTLKDENGPKGAQSSETNPQPQKDDKGPKGNQPKPAKPSSTKAPEPSTKVNETKGTIDSCLLGTWRSESVVRKAKSGGAGIVMTVKGDGEVTIDYTGMQEVKQVIAGQVVAADSWSGSATGHITTANGLVTVISVDKSALTGKEINKYGTKSVSASGLGPVFEGASKTYQLTYTCDDASLIIKATLQGQAIDTYTFKREKKAP